jgi:hypothetical protein
MPPALKSIFELARRCESLGVHGSPSASTFSRIYRVVSGVGTASLSPALSRKYGAHVKSIIRRQSCPCSGPADRYTTSIRAVQFLAQAVTNNYRRPGTLLANIRWPCGMTWSHSRHAACQHRPLLTFWDSTDCCAHSPTLYDAGLAQGNTQHVVCVTSKCFGQQTWYNVGRTKKPHTWRADENRRLDPFDDPATECACTSI